MAYVTIAAVTGYNEKRYSRPWAAKVVDGRMQFFSDAFRYDDERNQFDGWPGHLVIGDPEVGQMYACGQKDRRRSELTIVIRVIWDGERFVPVDRDGNVLEDEPRSNNLTVCYEPQAAPADTVETEAEAAADENAAPEDSISVETDAEAAQVIADAVYGSRSLPIGAYAGDLARDAEAFLCAAVSRSEADNGGSPSGAYYIECLDPAENITRCTVVSDADGDHMKWSMCYAPTLREEHKRARGASPEQIEQYLAEYNKKRRPLATYRYTRRPDGGGRLEQVDVLEPEAAKRAAVLAKEEEEEVL